MREYIPKKWFHDHQPEVITSVRADVEFKVDDYEFKGFEIKTDWGQVIRCMIDTYENATEIAEVICGAEGDEPLESIVGKRIECIRYASDRIKMGDPDDRRGTSDSEEQRVTMCIEFSDGTKIHLRAFNRHNGYYPRRYLLQWHKNYDIDEL